jgi:hypothetical protein
MIAMSGSAAVFIHRDLSVLEKVKSSSGDHARTTHSPQEALSWIQDQSQPITAIYISPDQTEHSTFLFLEQLWKDRPAMPVFLLDQTLFNQTDNASRVLEKTAINGIFGDSIDIPRPTFNVDRRKKPSIDHESVGYTPIPVTDFLSHREFPFDVYFRVEDGSMRIFAEQGSPIDNGKIEKLSTQLDFLHVRNEVTRDRILMLQTTRETMIENPDFPDHWKTAEVLARSKNLLAKIRKSEMGNPIVSIARGLIDDLQKLIAHLRPESGSLNQLIDQALSNDRAVYCSTMAILICQQLKFEKKATLEILGIAAILQDISLYQTPAGDLSDRDPANLTAEEARYHHRHPILSSDILAHQTNIPQVTLQVIRQHHERKDRTGYPNRTGGGQLHPLAEILSLINCCYEVSHSYVSQKEALFALESEVFVHFSEPSVLALKKIHSRL